MGVLVVILLVAAVVGGVMLNRKTSEAAMHGILVKATVAPSSVTTALTEIYCGGAKATFRSMASGVQVTKTSNSTFHYQTKHGDRGSIEVRPDGSGSLVVASAESLFIGSKTSRNFRSGVWAISAALVNWFCVACNIAPNAAKLKRFQNGIEGRLRSKLGAAAVPTPVAPVARPSSPSLPDNGRPRAEAAVAAARAPLSETPAIPATRAEMKERPAIPATRAETRPPDETPPVAAESVPVPRAVTETIISAPVAPEAATVSVDGVTLTPDGAAVSSPPTAERAADVAAAPAIADDDGGSVWG